MRILPVLIPFVAIASLSAAFAQDDGRVLIDPGTGQERYVPPLMQPWQTDEIKLHPPSAHHRAARKTAPAPEAPAADTVAPQRTVEAAPPPAPKKPKRVAVQAPAPQTSPTMGNISDFTDLISPQSSAPPPKKTAAPVPPKPAPVKRAETPVEKPVQQASIEPPKPPKPRTITGTPKGTIEFAANASDPSTSAVASVRGLAEQLNSALSSAAARVQLMAYGGQRGEKSSDTRRLSLKRALVIRQLLIDDGVPAERIDVFALGGVDDSGPLDRVDVFVKS